MKKNVHNDFAYFFNQILDHFGPKKKHRKPFQKYTTFEHMGVHILTKGNPLGAPWYRAVDPFLFTKKGWGEQIRAEITYCQEIRRKLWSCMLA